MTGEYDDWDSDDQEELWDQDDRYETSDEIYGAINDLSKFVEGLIVPSKRSAVSIHSLALVLLALRRMPFPTLGINETVSVVLSVNKEVRFFDLRISDDGLELSDGGSVYTEGVGSDSYSSICFSIQTGGYMEGSEYDIFNWIDNATELLNMEATLSIESYSACDEVDWDEEIEI